MNVTLSRPKTVKSKGVKWNELQNSEQVEILQQIKGLQADPQIKKYLFYKTFNSGWIITNSFDVPMSGRKSYFKGA